MNIKKTIILILLIVLCVVLGLKFGCRDLWIPGVMKKLGTGSVSSIKQDIDDSEKRYRKQLESAEKVGSNYERLGKKYTEQQNWTPALEAFNKALEYGNAGPEIHFLIGATYANRAKETGSKSDIESSERHYKLALSKNPNFHRANYGLGLLSFYIKNDKQKGIEIMRELVSKKNDFYDARFALGRFYYENSEPNKALSVYEELYSDLQKRAKSDDNTTMLKECQANITRIMTELSL